jgi:hypothetical protein
MMLFQITKFEVTIIGFFITISFVSTNYYLLKKNTNA